MRIKYDCSPTHWKAISAKTACFVALNVRNKSSFITLLPGFSQDSMLLNYNSYRSKLSRSSPAIWGGKPRNCSSSHQIRETEIGLRNILRQPLKCWITSPKRKKTRQRIFRGVKKSQDLNFGSLRLNLSSNFKFQKMSPLSFPSQEAANRLPNATAAIFSGKVAQTLIKIG